MENIALGTDIGGSHITCQLINLDTNTLLVGTRKRIHVDSRAPGNDILKGWTAALTAAAGPLPITSLAGIGFAMPGPFDYPGGTAWFRGVEKFENLYGINIRKEIHDRLHLPGSFRVRFFNDASCFAIGETWLGHASGFERVIAVTIGTGFGSTFISNKVPVRSADGIPEDGFLYNVPFGNSIADDYFSTRWFLKKYTAMTGKQAVNVEGLLDIIDKEKAVRDIFNEFGNNLGTFLGPWIKKFNAGCVVMGGNISKSHMLFQTELESGFHRCGVRPVVYVSSMEEDAALYGSARLCDDSFYSRLMET